MNRYSLNRNKETEDIILKTRREMNFLKTSGTIVGKILSEISRFVRPGISTARLEDVCRERVAYYSRERKIRKYPDFPTCLSVSVNNTAVHGVPDNTVLRSGDIVTLDLALMVDGWYGDSAVTIPVRTIAPKHARLIDAARDATLAGIRQAKAGNRIGDIGAAIQAAVEKYDAHLFEVLVGHGIGRTLHEGPVVFMKGEADVGQPIVPGMVFTIEPVLTLGRTSYYKAEDGFSLITEDGEYTAMFEHMVAILPDKTLVLTDIEQHGPEKKQ